jgi:hypothetical protein
LISKINKSKNGSLKRTAAIWDSLKLSSSCWDSDKISKEEKISVIGKILLHLVEGLEISILSIKGIEERFDNLNSLLKGIDHVATSIQTVLFNVEEIVGNSEIQIFNLEKYISKEFIFTNTLIKRTFEEMAKLTTDKRKKLSKSEFGMPKEKKYPMPDKSHAVNAKARATQMEKKGKLSPASKVKIDKKADKVIAKKRGRPKKEEGKMSIVSDKRIKDYGDKKKKSK